MYELLVQECMTSIIKINEFSKCKLSTVSDHGQIRLNYNEIVPALFINHKLDLKMLLFHCLINFCVIFFPSGSLAVSI